MASTAVCSVIRRAQSANDISGCQRDEWRRTLPVLSTTRSNQNKTKNEIFHDQLTTSRYSEEFDWDSHDRSNRLSFMQRFRSRRMRFSHDELNPSQNQNYRTHNFGRLLDC